MRFPKEARAFNRFRYQSCLRIADDSWGTLAEIVDFGRVHTSSQDPQKANVLAFVGGKRALQNKLGCGQVQNTAILESAEGGYAAAFLRPEIGSLIATKRKETNCSVWFLLFDFTPSRYMFFCNAARGTRLNVSHAADRCTQYVSTTRSNHAVKAGGRARLFGNAYFCRHRFRKTSQQYDIANVGYLNLFACIRTPQSLRPNEPRTPTNPIDTSTARTLRPQA